MLPFRVPPDAKELAEVPGATAVPPPTGSPRFLKPERGRNQFLGERPIRNERSHLPSIYTLSEMNEDAAQIFFLTEWSKVLLQKAGLSGEVIF